jgi:site-specific recombinase XerD
VIELDHLLTTKETIMSYGWHQILARAQDAGWREALRWAGAFIAGFSSAQTRRSYQLDVHCWFAFCAAHGLHPYNGVRRTHVELYLRELEQQLPQPSNATLYRRISTLSSWFSWLEDEEVIVGNPAARVRRPSRHPRPQP